MTDRGPSTLRLCREHVEWRLVEGEIVALDLRDSTYFAINATGAVLWQPLIDGTDRARLATTLVEHYGIEEGRALADVDAFLAMLEEHQLLDRS